MKTIEKIYCVDIGNTHTHCAVVSIKDGIKVETSQDYHSKDFYKVFLDEYEQSGAQALSWCSVVPSYSAIIRSLLGKDILSYELTYDDSAIDIDLDNPEQVGQDRLADAIGASVFMKAPYIVIDMGTAATIDVVDKHGVYVGGVISPGLDAFTNYLSQKTAQLPVLDTSEEMEVSSIGKNTHEAMYIGCAKGFCNMVDSFIKDIKQEYFPQEDIENKIIFTGGSVASLPKTWVGNRKVEPNLAQIGLASAFISKIL